MRWTINNKALIQIMMIFYKLIDVIEFGSSLRELYVCLMMDVNRSAHGNILLIF